MGEALELDGTTPSTRPPSEDPPRLFEPGKAAALTDRLGFAGDCSVKTGPDGSTFGSEYFDHLARSFETQTWVYERGGSGWLMWTWKTEQAADWSMTTGMLYGGWVPGAGKE